MQFLGIDTSNYTTSAALYSGNGNLIQQKKLLPLKEGCHGLRQSDAVFHHTQQLPEVIERLAKQQHISPAAIGVSVTPRNATGSYMPCFTVGASTARSLSCVLDVPLYKFSHQEGHIAAALYSSHKLDLLNRSFLAFHISGGTTEALLINGIENKRMNIELVAKTLDLNAGQAVDRVGVMLGMRFPCGKELEKAALKYDGKFNFCPSLKGYNCCLSGIENQCGKMLENGETPEKIAAYCLFCIEQTVSQMCERLLNKYGTLPIIFAGGVMSNSIIRSRLEKRFASYFAEPEFSSDNAAGTAVLTELIWRTEG